MTERVLVTGARAAAALDIARSLRAAGFEPHLADCSPARLARWSNGAGPVHRYASPVRRPAAFADDIGRLIDRLAPVRIIPACEEVFHLAALAEVRGFADRLFAPPPDILAALHAKDRFADLCRDLALPAPETRAVADPDALEAGARDLGDVVLKPVWSRFGSRTLVAPTPEQRATARPSPDDPWVVQQRIVGEDVSFYALCEAGRVAAFAAYGSDWRAAGGAALAFRPLTPAVAARLRPMADVLAAHVGRGQISCDAVIDAQGRPWLIECNPRATSGVHLFDRGAAFGLALAGRGQASPADATRHLGPALWRRGLSAADRTEVGRDVLSAPGDPLPPFGALADAAGFALSAFFTGRSLTQAMTADIEWNGRPIEAVRWSRP
jgi:hypothetical protein